MAIAPALQGTTRVEAPLLVDDASSHAWDKEVDVLVVGFGGAGACAALEAAQSGAQVLAVDRFAGGGATAISGGVVYAGGGSRWQQEAGAADTPDEMFTYLSMEVGDVVPPAVLREFCEKSAEMLEWLNSNGVPFEASLCPYKTSYPTNDFYLYYSGNESFPPFKDSAKPAPRGHRAKGKGLPGASFYAPLRDSALNAGATLMGQTEARRLILDGAGGVLGAQVWAMPAGAFATKMHRLLAWLAMKVKNYSPQMAKRCQRRLARLEKTHARPLSIRARGGVILSSGGFIYNRKMVKHYAPTYRPGMPLGTFGCNGSGIQLGQSAGAATDRMGRVSAWRFINPPEAWTRGILVDRQGQRYVNERLYGAAIGQRMVDEHEGEGILIVDEALWKLSRQQVGWPGQKKVQWFQQAPALLNLYTNCREAESIEGLAERCKIPPEALRATVDAYNALADEGAGPDPLGKDKPTIHPLVKGPFYAMDCGLASKRFPCPTLTLGGLVVDTTTGQVQSEEGEAIAGLYAAGRTAVGISSNAYVSGLSLADCVFSGRRAGLWASKKG